MPAIPASKRSTTALKRELANLLAADKSLADQCCDAVDELASLHLKLKTAPRSDRPAIRRLIVQAKDEVCRLGCLVIVNDARIDMVRARIEAGWQFVPAPFADSPVRSCWRPPWRA